MAALVKSSYSAEITWLGVNATRAENLRSEAAQQVTATFDGFEGEDHGGATRPCCVRFSMLHDRNTEIRNFRQLSILSHEEMAEIAEGMELDDVDPQWIGANLIVRGIPDLSHLPPGSRLQGPDGTTLYIDLENGPCVYPGKEIEAERPGHGKAFKPSAMNRRGVTACVERGGTLQVGEQMELFVPTQPQWAGLG